MSTNLHNLREDYRRATLGKSDLEKGAMTQFKKWFLEAQEAQTPEPNAFILATVSTSGNPSTRTVLLKEFTADSFVFYTNYKSQKSQEINANSTVAMTFLWKNLQRQVQIEGVAYRNDKSIDEAYFQSRPRESQLGAWASEQSAFVESRTELERRYASYKDKYEGNEIPMPPYWGGYYIVPQMIEFWQGRASRMHDRLVYYKNSNGWEIKRKCP